MRALRRGVSTVLAWPTWVWLAGLGLVLLIRFPIKFFFFESSPYLMDFEVFRAVAQRVMAGDAPHLYASVGTEQMMFKYAPCWMLLVAPIAWFPWRAALAMCSALTAGWLVLTGWLSDRLCRLISLPPVGFPAVAAVSLLVRPITSEFLLGQTNLLWGALVAAYVWLDVTRRPWRAALCLTLAISLKVPAALFLAYLALRGRFDVIARTLALFLTINLAAACWLAPSGPFPLLASWFRVLAVSGPDRAFEIGSQSLLALMGRLLRRDGYGLNLLALSDATVAGAAVVLELALFLACFRPRAAAQEAPARTVIEGALVSVFMVLFSPTCWIATYNAALFAATLAVGLLMEPPSRAWRRPSLVLGAVGLLTFSAMTHSGLWRSLGVHHVRRGESYVYLVFMILPLFGLALAWTLWRLRAVHAGTSRS